MQEFKPYEYLLIDIANNFNLKLDKELFEVRIKWVIDNIKDLELIGAIHEWKEKPLYIKAVQALRTVQQGKPTGHMIGFDAVCSGLQLMAVMTGCVSGAEATGLIDPNKRADAYKECLTIMQGKIPTVTVDDLKKVKKALMTSFYGSKAEPKKLFGDGTPELEAFYESMFELSPGACELLKDLGDSWQPYAEKHSWIMPDNHHVHVRVTDKVDIDIEVDELEHHTFSYRYSTLVPKKKGISNIANVVHSVDGYVLRSLVRRCSYDPELLYDAQHTLANPGKPSTSLPAELYVLIKRYEATRIADLTILPLLHKSNVGYLAPQHVADLNKMIAECLTHPPFDIVTIHDDFKCHPNNMNQLRKHYLAILVQLADSTILDDIFSMLYGKYITFTKVSNDLSSKMVNANYFLS